MVSEESDYKAAIEILQAGNYNPREVCFELAKRWPDILVSIVMADYIALAKEIRQEYSAGGLSSAVNLHRKREESSLEDAVNEVKRMCKDLLPDAEGAEK